eukprot:snap_masked-scaffold_17-processed-gene-5.28-mRNA-1 protein AED:0.06 eAED:0.06 QI:0/-1/0/1/-1/1/1/0/378
MSFGSNLNIKVNLVRKTSCVSEAKSFEISPSSSISALLQQAASQLQMSNPAERIFTLDGEEVTDLSFIQDGETLCVLDGFEKFSSQTNKSFKGNAPGFVGNYVVKKFLGCGSFGKVFLGKHVKTEEKVALKFMSKEQLESLDDLQRVLTEVQCLDALTHPNVIELKCVLNLEKNIVLAFECADKGDLELYLSNSVNNFIPESSAVDIFYQIIQGIGYCHRKKVIHYDLKLENILLSKVSFNSPHEVQIKLADFGLSHILQPGAKEKNYTAGSLLYLAPEVFSEIETYGPARDVWSVGVILFILLSGKQPFDAASRKEVIELIQNKDLTFDFSTQRISEECLLVLSGLLRKNPEHRFSVPQIKQSPWLMEYERKIKLFR